MEAYENQIYILTGMITVASLGSLWWSGGVGGLGLIIISNLTLS